MSIQRDRCYTRFCEPDCSATFGFTGLGTTIRFKTSATRTSSATLSEVITHSAGNIQEHMELYNCYRSKNELDVGNLNNRTVHACLAPVRCPFSFVPNPLLLVLCLLRKSNTCVLSNQILLYQCNASGTDPRNRTAQYV